MLDGNVIQKSVPWPVDSISLMPILNGGEINSPYLLTELFDLNPATDGRAIRDGRYRLVVFDSGSEAFYDLIFNQCKPREAIERFPDATITPCALTSPDLIPEVGSTVPWWSGSQP